MSYTLSDLQTKLLTQVGDPNLTTSVATDAIAYAEQEIFNKFDLTLNSSSQTNTVTSGTNTLASALPSDFQRTSDIVITSPTNAAGSLKDYFVTPEQFRQQFPSTALIGSGPLKYWTYWTSHEFSWNADQTYTLTLYYIKSVPILTSSSDVPTVPQSFEEMLMLGAKIRVYEQKEDFDYASQFYNRYADLEEAFISRYGVRQVDTQIQVGNNRQRATRA